MPKLIAKVAFTYANNSLQPGDSFEASDKDARVLRLINRAQDPEAGNVTPRRHPDALQPVAEQNPVDESKRSRRYQRRDMTASE